MLEALGTDGDRSLHHHGNLRVCKRSPVTMLCKELDQAEVLDTDDAVPDHVIPCRLCLQCPVTIHLPCLVVPAVVVRNVLSVNVPALLSKGDSGRIHNQEVIAHVRFVSSLHLFLLYYGYIQWVSAQLDPILYSPARGIRIPRYSPARVICSARI